MLLSKVRAVFGLSGKAVGTRPGIEWHPMLGTAAVARAFADADILYQLEIGDLQTASFGVVLTLSSGSAIASGGSVTSSLKDFEGTTLPTLSKLNGLLIERLDSATDNLLVKNNSGGATLLTLGAGEIVLLAGDGPTLGPSIGAGMELFFTVPGSFPASLAAPLSCRVTVLGQTA